MNKSFSKPKLEFNIGNNKKYKIETIIDNIFYTKITKNYLPIFYYLVFWKNYIKKKTPENFFLQSCFLKNDLHILQKLVKKANSNISFLENCFIYGQAGS